MFNTILGRASRAATHKVISEHAVRRGWLQPKFGFDLFKNPRVPVTRKLLAIAIGVGLTSLMVAAELPIESFLAFLLPALGIALDLVADGAETIVCPLLIATVLLPHLTPKQIIAEIDYLAANLATPGLATTREALVPTEKPNLAP